MGSTGEAGGVQQPGATLRGSDLTSRGAPEAGKQCLDPFDDHMEGRLCAVGPKHRSRSAPGRLVQCRGGLGCSGVCRGQRGPGSAGDVPALLCAAWSPHHTRARLGAACAQPSSFTTSLQGPIQARLWGLGPVTTSASERPLLSQLVLPVAPLLYWWGVSAWLLASSLNLFPCC